MRLLRLISLESSYQMLKKTRLFLSLDPASSLYFVLKASLLKPFIFKTLNAKYFMFLFTRIFLECRTSYFQQLFQQFLFVYSLINPSDCVDMECDGKKNILIKDMDGSVLGSPGSIIPDVSSRFTFVYCIFHHCQHILTTLYSLRMVGMMIQ